MIKHIVMWTLKAEANGASAQDNAKEMKRMLEALAGTIDELDHIEVSYDIVDASPECHAVLYSEFATKEALDAYQVHPAHQQCVAFIKPVVTERRVLDYAI